MGITAGPAAKPVRSKTNDAGLSNDESGIGLHRLGATKDQHTGLALARCELFWGVKGLRRQDLKFYAIRTGSFTFGQCFFASPAVAINITKSGRPSATRRFILNVLLIAFRLSCMSLSTVLTGCPFYAFDCVPQAASTLYSASPLGCEESDGSSEEA
jgi:hypothetical protein